MEPNGTQGGGKMAPKCIPKSIDRSIPLPIACKCHFEATLELQKASKSASILDESRLSIGATRHRGISEKCAFSPRKTMFFTTQPWRSSIQFKQTRTKKRSSLGHHNQEAFATPFRHHFCFVVPFGRHFGATSLQKWMSKQSKHRLEGERLDKSWVMVNIRWKVDVKTQV